MTVTVISQSARSGFQFGDNRAMRLALLTMVWLGACAFPGNNNGGPDGGTDGGTDGGSNDGMVQDPDDRDGDGKANAQDNCPDLPNPSQENSDRDQLGDVCDNCKLVDNDPLPTMGWGLIQRDHDLDGRGDECDPCPHLAAMSDIDADADGIGAACDPDDAARNAKPEFNGFYDPPVEAQWLVPSGAGVFTDWELEQTADKRLWWRQKTLDVGRHQLQRNRPDLNEVHVESGFRLAKIAPEIAGTSPLRSAGVTYSYQINDGRYFTCGVRDQVPALTDTVAFVAVYSGDAPQAAQSRPWTGDLLNRDIRVISESKRTLTGSALSCTTLADPATNIVIPATSGLSSSGKIGLRTYGITASFDYLYIVDMAVLPATGQ